MWIELFVDSRNERAIRFWQRQGFADIGTSEGNQRFRRFMRHAWPESETEPTAPADPG